MMRFVLLSAGFAGLTVMGGVGLSMAHNATYDGPALGALVSQPVAQDQVLASSAAETPAETSSLDDWIDVASHAPNVPDLGPDFGTDVADVPVLAPDSSVRPVFRGGDLVVAQANPDAWAYPNGTGSPVMRNGSVYVPVPVPNVSAHTGQSAQSPAPRAIERPQSGWTPQATNHPAPRPAPSANRGLESAWMLGVFR